ncbi:MAG: transcription termination/antitermination protein NusA [Rickettsiales bacterium]|nr:transcription termination/antitermination protein NusA [Rickettsiales bacterium]
MIVIDNLEQVANQIESERGVDKSILYSAIETALASACRKRLHSQENIVCELDIENGSVKFYTSKTVVKTVEDDSIEISFVDAKKIDKSYKIDDDVKTEFMPPDFGRIAAQTAKQVIIQRLREAEKESVHGEFSEKVNEIITGTVQRVENNNYLINLGRTEAILYYRDQIPGERFSQNESIRVYVTNVEKTNRGNIINISRTHPGFLRKLFEKEIPEIQDGIIEIKSVSRVPGDRAKVAVKTNNPAIGAVGTCVGQMGNRIQSIIKELHNEKIDVLEWDEDIKKFISNALKPAQIDEVIVTDEDEKQATIKVSNDQLSLAIGKKGTNVRLSVLLTGWKLNIVDENNEKQGSDSNVSLLEKMQKSKEEENSQSMEIKEEEALDLSNSSLAQAISKDSSEQNTKEEAQNEEVKVSTEKEETNEKEEAPKE